MRPSQRLPIIALLLSSVGWGLTWLPAKALLELGLTSGQSVLIAFGAGALLLLPALWRQRRRWWPLRWLLFGIAAAGGFSYATFQTAIAQGETVRVMILFYLLPVWSALGGRYVLGERLDARRAIAIVVCIAGAALALAVDGSTLRQPPSLIDVLAIASGMTLAINNLLFRRAEKIPLSCKVAAMYCGCALLIACSLPLALSAVTAQAPAMPTATGALAAALYGVLWIAPLTFATQWAVTQLEVAHSALILVIELIVAVLSTALLVKHGLALHEAAGALLVLGAVLIESGTAQSARAGGAVDPERR